MNTPLLSIIVPVYNTATFLNRCIDSILTQKYTHFELILIDDGSKDQSGKICDEYAQNDSRIVVIHKPNGGQSSARNAGLNIAKGDYITFVDSDDYISMDCYQNNMEILSRDKSIDILEYPIYTVNKGNIEKLIIPRYNEEEHLYNKQDIFLFWSNNGIGVRGFVWQNIYQKKIWENTRFKEGVIFEDCLIQSTLLEKASHVYISGIGKYFYEQRENSTIHSKLTISHCKDDFNGTIPFLFKMIQHNVKRKYIVHFYCVTLNRIIDKSYLFESNSFTSQIEEIQKASVSWIEIFLSNINLRQKIKILLFKLLGEKRYFNLTRMIFNRKEL